MHAGHARALHRQADGARPVADLRSGARGGGEFGFHQAGTAAPGLDGQTAPEAPAPADLERLATVHGHEAHAPAAHPLQSRQALADQNFHEIGIGAVFGHARHVVEEAVGGIAPEIGVRPLLLAEVGDEGEDVVQAVIGDAHGAGGEARVSAAQRLRGAFEHDDGSAAFARRQRRAHRRVAGADDRHVPNHRAPVTRNDRRRDR